MSGLDTAWIRTLGPDRTVQALCDEVDGLRAAVGRVQTLHYRVDPLHVVMPPWCHHDNQEFPCSTLRAIDGPES